MNKYRGKSFKVINYTLTGGRLIIEGQKFPPPSKRIILNQPNIKVLSAKIVAKTKKGEIEYEVIRINRVKSFGEIRLHTNNILYPGLYQVTIDFSGELNKESLDKQGN